MSLDPTGAVLGLAAQAEAMSQRMSDEAAQLGRHTRVPQWRGPAADAQARRTEQLCADLRRNALELDEVAAALRAHASVASERFADISRAIAKGAELALEAGEAIYEGVTP